MGLKLLKTVLAGLLTIASLHAGADNTLRGRRLHPRVKMADSATRQPQADTLRLPDRAMIELTGYDKPLRSAYESFLLTNLTAHQLRSLAVTLDYYDMEGHQLHQRCDTIPIAVPAGETRMIKLSTWDTQRSYYYHQGRKPATPRVTPYSIRARVDFVTFTPEITPEAPASRP